MKGHIRKSVVQVCEFGIYTKSSYFIIYDIKNSIVSVNSLSTDYFSSEVTTANLMKYLHMFFFLIT